MTFKSEKIKSYKDFENMLNEYKKYLSEKTGINYKFRYFQHDPYPYFRVFIENNEIEIDEVTFDELDGEVIFCEDEYDYKSTFSQLFEKFITENYEPNKC